jgi:hypothetical protein
LNLVEGSASSEAEKEAAHGLRAGYVGAPTTPGVIAHRGKEKGVVKHLNDGEKMD